MDSTSYWNNQHSDPRGLNRNQYHQEITDYGETQQVSSNEVMDGVYDERSSTPLPTRKDPWAYPQDPGRFMQGYSADLAANNEGPVGQGFYSPSLPSPQSHYPSPPHDDFSFGSIGTGHPMNQPWGPPMQIAAIPSSPVSEPPRYQVRADHFENYEDIAPPETARRSGHRYYPQYNPPADNELQTRDLVQNAHDQEPNSRTNQGNPTRSLDPAYEHQKKEFFKTGRVFLVIWHENAGNNTGTRRSVESEFTVGRFGERIYSTPRRMVVIGTHPGTTSSLCVGIFTYGGRGLSKDGIDIANHAVLYNEKDEPSMRPDEPDLDRQCLAVKLRRPQDKLDPMSRINFGKIHTIEHNIPVKPIGMIAESSMAYFNDIVDHSVEIVEVSGKAPLRIDILDQLLYVTPSLNGLLVNMERTQARN